jgi:hypothetical protein
MPDSLQFDVNRCFKQVQLLLFWGFFYLSLLLFYFLSHLLSVTNKKVQCKRVHAAIK